MENIKIIVKKNETKFIPYIWINSKEEEIAMDVELIGDGAQIHIIGIFLGSQNHHVTFNVKVVHKAPHTKSNTTIRSVFLNQSSFDNDACIQIMKGASGTDAYFQSKILLCNNAKGRSVPSLEIDENEVKAGHASTVGRPDEEQLFYLQSRGLTEKESERLIISGFFNPLITFLPDLKKQEIEKQIEAVLKSNFTL